ncbi:MAG: putative metallopeptidase [Thermoplasmatota archaeon]
MAPKRKGGRARRPFELDVAPDVQARIEEIARALPEFWYVDPRRVVCFRSRGSTARIYARIWGLERIWQLALGVEAHYAIEVVEAFDASSPAEQDRTLIHELMHIPKTMSGALVPHNCFGRRIDCHSVEPLYRRLLAHRAALAREGSVIASGPEAPDRVRDVAPGLSMGVQARRAPDTRSAPD